MIADNRKLTLYLLAKHGAISKADETPDIVADLWDLVDDMADLLREELMEDDAYPYRTLLRLQEEITQDLKKRLI